VKNLRKNFLGFGGGGGGGGVDTGGGVLCTWLGVGGVRGTFSGGIVDIVEAELGVEGVGDAFPVVKLVITGPKGGGSFVPAPPGRTMGFESEMLDLSAYPLCKINQHEHVMPIDRVALKLVPVHPKPPDLEFHAIAVQHLRHWT
jgi:hypothetical protein